MHKSTPYFILFSLFLLFTASITAQPVVRPPAEPSYEAVVQLVVGSDETSAAELPRSLSPVVKDLKRNFSYKSFDLVNTSLARIANTGTAQYKSVSSINNGDLDGDSTSFLDWNIGELKSGKNEAGRDLVQLDAFVFKARIPMKVASVQGKPVVTYESIGLTVGTLTVSPDTPLVIGALTLPKGSGTMFVILNIRPVER